MQNELNINVLRRILENTPKHPKYPHPLPKKAKKKEEEKQQTKTYK